MPLTELVARQDGRGYRHLQNHHWPFPVGQPFAMAMPQDHNQRFPRLQAPHTLAPSASSQYSNTVNFNRRAVKNKSSTQKSQSMTGKNSSPTKPKLHCQHPAGNTNHSGNAESVVVKIKNCSEAKRTFSTSTQSRYMSKPCKIDAKRGKLNPVINAPSQKTTYVYYKLSEPLLLQKKPKACFLTQLIDSKSETFHLIQPIRLANDENYQVRNLDELARSVSKYTNKPKSRSLAFSNTKPQAKTSKINSQFSVDSNESVDLSFDGKAMNKSDIFKMVDSFSLMIDDDDDDRPLFSTKNILPPEITS